MIKHNLATILGAAALLWAALLVEPILSGGWPPAPRTATVPLAPPAPPWQPYEVPGYVLEPLLIRFVWCYEMAYGIQAIPARGNLRTAIFPRRYEYCKTASADPAPPYRTGESWQQVTTPFSATAPWSFSEATGNDWDNGHLLVTYTASHTGRNVMHAWLWESGPHTYATAPSQLVDANIHETYSPEMRWLREPDAWTLYIFLRHAQTLPETTRSYRRVFPGWEYAPQPYRHSLPMVLR